MVEIYYVNLVRMVVLQVSALLKSAESEILSVHRLAWKRSRQKSARVFSDNELKVTFSHDTTRFPVLKKNDF